MHDAHAADAVFLAFIQEGQQGVAGLFHAQAVQVEFGARAPLAATQVARRVGRGVAAHEGGAAFGQQVDDFAAVGHAGVGAGRGLAQRVGAAQGRRGRGHGLVLDAGVAPDRGDGPQAAPQRLGIVGGIGGLGRRLARGSRGRGAGQRGALALGLQVLLQALQVGQADFAAFHYWPSPSSQRWASSAATQPVPALVMAWR